MRNSIRKVSLLYITFFALWGGLTSCEKVIQLDLNTSSSQIVIEGNVTDQPGPYTIKISNSVQIEDSNVFPAVSGATVTIRDNSGNSEVLQEDSAGRYVTSVLQGTPGRTYTLTVLTAGKTYTAISTMPDAVELDSLYSQKSDFRGAKQIGLQFKDPETINNYYHLLDYINDTAQESFIVSSDIVNQGKVISGALVYMDADMKSGDKYTLVLQCVDKGVYDYFRTAGIFNGQSASPSNPVSNISNHALGYFNACTVRSKTILIP